MYTRDGVITVPQGLHALELAEIEAWQAAPKIHWRSLRMVPVGTKVDESVKLSYAHRTFVRVAEGKYTGYYVTSFRSKEALPIDCVGGPPTLWRTSRDWGNMVILVVLTLMWQYPWPAVYIIGTLLVVWVSGLLRRLIQWYHGHMYFSHIMFKIPLIGGYGIKFPLRL